MSKKLFPSKSMTTLDDLTVLRRKKIKQIKKNKFTSSFFGWIRDPRSGIRDGEKSGSGIRDKHPGSATLLPILKNLQNCKYSPTRSLNNQTLTLITTSCCQCEWSGSEISDWKLLIHYYYFRFGTLPTPFIPFIQTPAPVASKFCAFMEYL